MASPTRWTWVWVNSGSWWWTGRPGVLQFMGPQRVGHDWATELDWTEPLRVVLLEYQNVAWNMPGLRYHSVIRVSGDWEHSFLFQSTMAETLVVYKIFPKCDNLFPENKIDWTWEIMSKYFFLSLTHTIDKERAQILESKDMGLVLDP